MEDDSATTTFTLFNKDAEILIGIPIEKVIDEIPEVWLINNVYIILVYILKNLGLT